MHGFQGDYLFQINHISRRLMCSSFSIHRLLKRPLIAIFSSVQYTIPFCTHLIEEESMLQFLGTKVKRSLPDLLSDLAEKKVIFIVFFTSWQWRCSRHCSEFIFRPNNLLVSFQGGVGREMTWNECCRVHVAGKPLPSSFFSVQYSVIVVVVVIVVVAFLIIISY